MCSFVYGKGMNESQKKLSSITQLTFFFFFFMEFIKLFNCLFHT